MESLERPLPGNLALPPNCGRIGAQGLRGADKQRPRLRRNLVWGGQAVCWTGPLSAVGSSGGVVDELGRLGLRWSGRGRRVAEGPLTGSQRGSGGGVCWKVGGASDAAGTQLARSRELPAQTG